MDATHLNAPRSISAAQLSARLGRFDAPIFVDVRKAPAFDAAARVIAGALRIAPDEITKGSEKLPGDREIVAYCVHGHEVSQNAASRLVAAGFNAAFLEGGIAHWEEERRPTMAKDPQLGLPSLPRKPSKWVTRERPKIDRIACPWLIRRFIDPMAEFLYVPSETVIETGRRENATPYDVPAVRFSHRGDDGELCSFDSFIADFGLDDPCLADLATIVRGADTGKPELAPQSPGLLAISFGLSVNYPDDHAMLEQGMVVYDALYAWIKSARAEVHNAKLFAKP
jgi:rhodanese-related sulfurtransferase